MPKQVFLFRLDASGLGHAKRFGVFASTPYGVAPRCESAGKPCKAGMATADPTPIHSWHTITSTASAAQPKPGHHHHGQHNHHAHHDVLHIAPQSTQKAPFVKHAETPDLGFR